MQEITVVHPPYLVMAYGQIFIRRVETVVTLEEMQAMVDGNIQIIKLGKGIVMIVNEEGKLKGLPHNPIASEIMFDLVGGEDYVVGNALVLPEEMLK